MRHATRQEQGMTKDARSPFDDLDHLERQERELDAMCFDIGCDPATLAINRARYRSVLGCQVICERCRATAWTFKETCAADLINDFCDGDVAVELALGRSIDSRATPEQIARAKSLIARARRDRT
jgi:hypothetical protein